MNNTKTSNMGSKSRRGSKISVMNENLAQLNKTGFSGAPPISETQ